MTPAPLSVLGVAQTAVAFDVPPDACDCHVHVFGPVERFPFAAERVYTPGPATLEDLLALQAALHLHRVVIVQASPYGADNACLLDALERLDGRGRGVVEIPGTLPDGALRDMHARGVRGIRVNLESRGQRDPAAARSMLLEAASRASRLRWHVQTYTSLSVLASVQDAILELGVPLVVDHFGLPRAAEGAGQRGFDTLLSLLRRGSIYVKISAPYRISDRPDYADAEALVHALIDANPNHIMWGSDWPHPGGRPGMPRDPGRIEPFRPEDDGAALNRLRRWVSDSGQLKKILVDNPARLYGFSPRGGRYLEAAGRWS